MLTVLSSALLAYFFALGIVAAWIIIRQLFSNSYILPQTRNVALTFAAVSAICFIGAYLIALQIV